MSSPKHLNDGACEKCKLILARYPGFHAGLAAWFYALQAQHKDAHVSCGGRGKVDQEQAVKVGASRAHYGESAHNYNLALDIFQLTQSGGAGWPKGWFDGAVAPAVKAQNEAPATPFKVAWYGAPGSKFFELPHCEVAGWRDLKDKRLVEPT